MRAIIIEEERFTELCDLLKAAESDIKSHSAEAFGISQRAWAAAVEEARRKFHHVFVRWAQSHGASCIK